MAKREIPVVDNAQAALEDVHAAYQAYAEAERRFDVLSEQRKEAKSEMEKKLAQWRFVSGGADANMPLLDAAEEDNDAD